ncbi:hypothetical protein ACTVOX_25520 [Serratia marcescens]|uniref:hypothetical protein n=1 Tax=Serratia marcescens TaxID=615 RepID=UPI003FA6E6E6
MFGFSSGVLVNLSDDERQLLVTVISGCLRRAGGDAGGMMMEAYRQILAEADPEVRHVMLELIESVRIKYVSS